jgi:hypothetical protein
VIDQTISRFVARLNTAYHEHDSASIGLRTGYATDSPRSGVRYAKLVRKAGFPQ